MNHRSSITIGNYRVGYLQVDAAAVRAEGGALSPALVIPATLQLEPRDEANAIAITEVLADLVLPHHPGAGMPIGTQLGAQARASSITAGGGLWSSIPTGTAERVFTLRFALAREHVHLLEDHAQRLTEGPIELGLTLYLGAAWIRQSNDAPQPRSDRGQVVASTGLASELWPMWEARVEPLVLRLAREDWAKRLLPALGAGQTRIIALRLPTSSRTIGQAAVQAFEAARVAYDNGNYRTAVQHCRDLRDAVQRHLGATGETRLADRVAELLDWHEDAPAKQLLDDLWRALVNISSAAHHERGRHIGASEARATLLLTATILEYLGRHLEPEP